MRLVKTKRCPNCESDEGVTLSSSSGKTTFTICVGCEYVGSPEKFRSGVRKEASIWWRNHGFVTHLAVIGFVLVIVIMLSTLISARVNAFSSDKELEAFLEGSRVDEQPYDIESQSCVDYTRQLALEALGEGNVIIPTPCYDSGEGHVMGIAFVGNKLVWIEPQLDTYWEVF